VNRSPDPDLVKVTEIFLVPSSFLVAALGTADTNIHRAAVSLLGLVISALWWVCSREALTEELRSGSAIGDAMPATRTRILVWLPLIFAAGWIVSLIGHLLIWNRPLGK
jgi:hypothetical protein